MHDTIIRALKEIDNNVYYGAVTEKDFERLTSADCIIFASSSYRRKGTASKDLIAEYEVFIIRENFIEESLILNVINTMESIPGIRLTGQPNNFEYLNKGNTNIVLETIRLQFARIIKRC